MPFVRISVMPPAAPAVQQRLAAGATTLMAEVLGKKAELTAILVEGPTGLWTIGQAPQAAAAHLEALVTEGTNTEAEKAAFLAAARELLARELGALPEATYVALRCIPPGDWGYDGLSQAARAAR